MMPVDEWTWGHKPGGYNGVHTREGCLLWCTDRHHTLEGGGASKQSFSDFMNDEPPVSVPPEIRAHAAGRAG
ncbi:hypothetical protein HQ535_16435 [bacterium]|nr:hypothetical protein [bacterium]